MSRCVLNKVLSTHEFKVLDKDSASQSIIVLTSSLETKPVPAVLKLTLAPTTSDNGLEVERELYTYVRDELQYWSPHFLVPYATGHCSDDPILDFAKSSNKSKRALFNEWIQLRSTFISKKVSDATWSRIGKDAKKAKMTVPAYLCFNDPEWKSKLHDVYFVFTPKMGGMTLQDFLQQGADVIPTCAIRDLMIQFSQALSVLAMRKVMHQDLHFGNVFVTTHAKPVTISYRYPKPASLETRQELVIYDWDRGYFPKGSTNRTLDQKYCEPYGECNRYQANFDWYTVLSHFIDTSEKTKHFDASEPRKVLGKFYSPYSKVVKKGQDGWFGLPCTCIVARKGVCDKCKSKSLVSLQSPRDYFSAQKFIK